MNVHVIFMNDSPEFVFIGSEKDAEAKMEELAKEYWERNKYNIMDNLRLSNDEKAAYKDHRKHLYWHIHNVQTNGPVV